MSELVQVKLLSETDDTSLYALCRRWVRNDVPRKDQVEYSILFQILLEWFTKEIFWALLAQGGLISVENWAMLLAGSLSLWWL